MGWSDAFLAMLEAPTREPKWLLRFPPDVGGVGSAWSVGSVRGLGWDHTAYLTGVMRFGGSRVSPGSWSVTHGAWSVQVAGDVRRLLRRVTRGSIGILSMGFAGWDKEQFEPIAMGRLVNVKGAPSVFSLEFWDFLTSLQTRIDTTAAQLQLFYDVGVETTLSGAYATTDSVMNLTAAGTFDRETGTNGAVLVTPTTGDPFYAEWGGRTGNQLTGVSGGTQGTTDAAGASGDTVKYCGFIDDHPFDIVKKILTSTGGGTNGDDDTLPIEWGYGIDDSMLDVDDIESWRTEVVLASNNALVNWEVIVTDPVDNGLQWLQALLSDAGLWMTVRQGRITCRAAQQPTGQTVTSPSLNRDPLTTGITITDHDIQEVRSWHAFSTSSSYEVGTCKVTSNGGVGGYGEDPLGTLPAVEDEIHDLSDRVFANEANTRLGDAYRMFAWECRVPETLDLVCAGLRMAQLCPGDLVDVTSSQVHGRLASTIAGFDERRAMVTAVTPDWSGGSVAVSLAIAPTWDDEFPES